ncbi:hypothetical protein HZS_2171 [Henneguya salminicola]|nr:hypothetical protein HZS_2171 [Henneguya salminicola]
MKGDRYFETYTKKRRSGCSNDSVPEKTTISSLPDPMQATEGEWKIIEVVGMPQPPGTRIIFYAHYPFEDLSFYDMITKPDTNAHHKIYKLHEALQYIFI